MDTTRPKRIVFDTFNPECPSRTVLDQMASKWTSLVVCALREGPVRFGALKRGVGGITQKMLSQTLRSLERDGVIERRVFPTVPPSVEYRLTSRGVELMALLDGIRTWSEKNVAKILVSRKEYDARSKAPIEAVG